MKKNIIQDIKVNKKPLSSVLPKTDFKSVPISRKIEEKKFEHYVKKYKKNHTKKIIFTLFVLTLLLGGTYWVGVIFENAKVNIVAKKQSFELKAESFTASKDVANSIAFEIMITPDEMVKNLNLTQSQNVTQKATGTVTFYNENSTKAQKIPANTFISDENGKTYKTDSSIVIPGYTTVANNVTPGQVSASITAFLPGDAYNGNPKNFYVNSFKNTTKYKKIYAEAETPISGGAQGLVYSLSPNDKGIIDSVASLEFKNSLLNKVKELIPSGYILYPGTEKFSYSFDENAWYPTPDAKIKIDGSISAILIKETDLSTVVIHHLLPDISDQEFSEISVSKLADLTFAFDDPNQEITKDLSNFNFNLSGNVDLSWAPDMSFLKSKLLGIDKESVSSIFKLDPGVVNATVKIFPFWQNNIPNDPTKVNLLINNLTKN